MICFRDMTFCTAPCGTLSCDRKFTPRRRQEARDWWRDMPGEPPIAAADMRLGCLDWTPGTDTGAWETDDA